MSISRLYVVSIAIRVSIRAIERVVHCAFMVMNWLNIVLIVESVV